MPNRECNLTKRIRTEQGLRFCPVVLSANGRVKPDWVLVNGKEERHPEGSYYIEWREGLKRIRASVGRDAADANARRLRKEAELNAVNHGVVVAENGTNSNHRLIASAVSEYLDEIKITRSSATHSAYDLALRNFFGRDSFEVHPGGDNSSAGCITLDPDEYSRFRRFYAIDNHGDVNVQ